MCQVAPHPLQLLPRGALGSGQISHRPQGPCRSHWSSLAGSSWASCSRPVHTGWCSQVSGDWGDGGAAAGGPGRGGAEREGTRAGGEREGGRPSSPGPESLGEEGRSWHAQEEEPCPVLPGPFLSGRSLSTPGPPWPRAGWAALSAAPWWGPGGVQLSAGPVCSHYLFPQGCSSHLQHLEAVSLSSQWADPPKARRPCPLAQPRSARLPPRALGLPDGSSGLGVAVERGCMGKDPMARNTAPCPAGPRGQEPWPSLPRP